MNSNEPRVSIITPTYNRADFLLKNIKTIISQSYKNFEHIVIDGGSIDNTLCMLKEYKSKYDLKYVSRRDKGMYYAINDGIKMATGDIIAYLNSDDLYFPWTLERAVQEFIKDDSLDMIYGDSMVLDMSTGIRYLNLYASHYKFWLPLGGVLCQPTVFLRRRVFEKIGYFDTDYKYLADCEYWNRLNSLRNSKIKKIDEFMAIECNHERTLREVNKDSIALEQDSIQRKYSKVWHLRGANGIKKLYRYIQRESKILHFVLLCYLWKSKRKSRWQMFLNKYKIKFSFVNYILCKIYHAKKTFPRFFVTKRF